MLLPDLIFSRAIKIAEIHKPESSSAFAKLIGAWTYRKIDSYITRPVQNANLSWRHNCSSDFKLKVEASGIIMISSADPRSGFISPRINSEGVVPPDPKREKRNGRGKVKQQKVVRQKYAFVTASKRGQKYRDYFNPNNAVQLRVMGMEDTVVCVTIPLLAGHALVLCSSHGGLSP